jgi:hypothetical protein
MTGDLLWDTGREAELSGIDVAYGRKDIDSFHTTMRRSFSALHTTELHMTFSKGRHICEGAFPLFIPLNYA